MDRRRGVMTYVHRGVWIVTGLMCFYAAFDSVRKGRSAGDVIILVAIGLAFLGLTGWAMWRERRAREREDIVDSVSELTDLP